MSRGPGLRRAAKLAAEHMLLATGAPHVSRRRHARDVLILAYHNVVPDDAPPCGDASLHLPRRQFAEQLDTLCDTHDVVPISKVLEPADGDGRPRAVLTFDDAYQGALTLGIDELARRGLPAAVFVAPRFVGGAPFWWDAIVVPPSVRGETSFRERALREAGGRDANVRELAARRGYGERQLPEYARCATEAQISDALARARITLGSHSWSHANLAVLPTSELREEVSRPLPWLRERWTSVLPILAYPYGRASDRVVTVVRAAGYAMALRIDGGWLRASQGDLLLAPRVEVPAGLSRAGFTLRAAGLLAS